MNVKFINVSKSFGSINAVTDINLEINSGDFVFIIGPSGAGKSTLLKMILHQFYPTSGEVYLDGQILNPKNKNNLDKIRQNIGVIFQDYQLIIDKTIEENIALALDINNVPQNEIPERVEKVINQVNLNSRRHLFPSQLSGGELQRAALARALAIQPKIILADEPTGNLDTENAWNLIKLIKDINEQSGTTIVMTTHNLDIIKSLSKRVIVMSGGSIVSDSTQIQEPAPKKIKKKHKSSKNK